MRGQTWVSKNGAMCPILRGPSTPPIHVPPLRGGGGVLLPCSCATLAHGGHLGFGHTPLTPLGTYTGEGGHRFTASVFAPPIHIATTPKP